MPHQTFNCRLCEGSNLESLGDIAPGDFFAGRVLPEPIPGGRLWHCLGCGSLLRHPILTASAYRELYEGGAGDQWSGDSERYDLAAVRAALRGYPDAVRILDVGCGTADFLESLPARLEKFGVEPAIDAASKATGRGVNILAPTLEELPGDVRFDVITMIDVIEHVPEPAAILEKAIGFLSPGGILVVSTGDPETSWWRRIFRSRFWYSSFPEHISFPSRRFYDDWARKSRAQVMGVTRTRYRGLPLWKSAVFFVIQGVYLVSPWLLDCAGRCLALLARSPEPRRRHFSPGIGGVFTDHWVVTIRREP